MVLSFVLLLASMNREYVNTFLSTKTGNIACQEKFLEPLKDEAKFSIFYANKYKWKRQIDEAVKMWLNGRLPVWLNNLPQWFTPEKMSRIPDDLVEDETLLLRIWTEQVQRILQGRRDSFVGELAQSGGEVEAKEGGGEDGKEGEGEQ